jgi:hypothetical protein
VEESPRAAATAALEPPASASAPPESAEPSAPAEAPPAALAPPAPAKQEKRTSAAEPAQPRTIERRPPERRTPARRASARAERVRSVPVTVSAEPGAEITIDGRRAGTAPLEDIDLEPGPHRFIVRLPDGRVVERFVDVRGTRFNLRIR